MARIVELVLILNGLGGIATYLGIKAHRLKRGARKLVGVSDEEGAEKYGSEWGPGHPEWEEEWRRQVKEELEAEKRAKKKPSFLARVGNRIS